MLLFLPILFMVLRVAELLIIARAISSWFDPGATNPVIKLLHEVTEPVLKLVRPLARKIPGAIDWSPMIAILALDLARRLLTHFAF